MLSLARIVSLLRNGELVPFQGPFAHSLEILILQPTPFCNIDCDYCYLANRNNSKRMTLDVVRKSVQLVTDGGLVNQRLCIVWHAGEPLVLPIPYYEEVFAVINEEVAGRYEISHSFQTNGTLVDDSWCEFFQRHRARVGISIDGPAFLHDRHRKTRQGKPTHAQVVRGIENLRRNGIPFHAIAVLSANSLNHAEAIFRFFEDLGVTEVGFNVEELEGGHTSSSLASEEAIDQLQEFWARLYEVYDRAQGRLQIREFRKMTRAILTAKTESSWQEVARQNDHVLPFRILSVDCEGRISTFSPELLGIENDTYGDFVFGTVGRDDLAAIRRSPAFNRVAKEIMRGVHNCSRTCEYFGVCGGGAPSNKYFENKSLSSTVTLYCRTSIQLPVSVVLSQLERKISSSAASS